MDPFHPLQMDRPIVACVTGGTGLIGRQIVKLLLEQRYEVRVLTRNPPEPTGPGPFRYYGGCIERKESLLPFLDGCDLLFHCAAEKQDAVSMKLVNVTGTENILTVLSDSAATYFCHISTIGVIGKTETMNVDENAQCRPINRYETTKYAAEQLVMHAKLPCKVAILRPTNVVDDHRRGGLLFPEGSDVTARLKLFLKGAEHAHIVHAEDVARAAMHLMPVSFGSPSIYHVSLDDDPMNTFAAIWSLYAAIVNNNETHAVAPAAHLPVLVPYFLRRIRTGASNRGDIRYASEKLLATGFVYRNSVEATIRRMVAAGQ